MEVAAHMHEIVKVYPETGNRANDGVSLTLRRGEILCLAGENGAGKTTLMKVLYGLEVPDSGSIHIEGVSQHILSPLHANRLGIGMVHQHFKLIEDFTVAQNVTLGSEPRKFRFGYDLGRADQLVDAVIKEHHFSIEASDKVTSLTVGQKQQVEIIKMLYRNVDILILDEPTAVLTEQEIVPLFTTLRTLADNGKSIILITHKLQEIKNLSDRVAIMRQGRMVGEFITSEIDEREISRLMMGQSISLQVNKVPYSKEKRPIITCESISVVKRNQERPLLQNVSFTAYSGEILGFAGVSGNGLGVLEAVLGGFLPISSGHIEHNRIDISRRDTRRARRDGLAYVPADRIKVGSASGASVAENLIIASRRQFSRFGVLRKSAMREHAESLLQKFSVAGSPHMPLGTLSGGNIQKVVLAREIEQYRDYIVFSEPTWGLDVASGRFVYERMIELRNRGAAVLLISSNLDEILSLADRIAVLYRGSIAALISGEAIHHVTKEELGSYMLGLACQKEYSHG